MRGWGCGIAVVLFAAAAPGASQPVYRCVDGATVSFQDTACAARGERLDLDVAPSAPPPPAVQALLAAYETRTTRTAGTGPRRSRASRQAAGAVSYRCTAADGRVDYLDRPCPKPRAAQGRPAPAVVEQRITRREACEGRHAALDPYEREKRGPPDCRS